MTYRNDADALEARLGVLEKDVADRTRERDEVARLLAEARTTEEARRWIENAPRRRRRRKFLFVAIATTVMVLGGLATAIRLRHDARRARNEQILHQFEQFTDDACGCKDKACIDKITDGMAKWSAGLAKDEDYTSERVDEDTMKRWAPIVDRYTKCATAAMTVESGVDSIAR